MPPVLRTNALMVQASVTFVFVLVTGGGALLAGSTIGADSTDLAAAVRRTEAELGPLTLAVNSAGIANAAPAEQMDRAKGRV